MAEMTKKTWMCQCAYLSNYGCLNIHISMKQIESQQMEYHMSLDSSFLRIRVKCPSAGPKKMDVGPSVDSTPCRGIKRGVKSLD